MLPTINLKSVARVSAGLLLATALGACQNTSTPTPQPALLVNPNDAARSELKDIVSNALNTEVTLSSKALTDKPVLIIDAASQPRSIDSATAQGSWRDRPDHFELYVANGKCVLKHRQSEREWPIADATCVAVSGER